MPERHSTKELFYGYPDWLIADWCCVTLQTARHWKSGIRAPGPAAVKLFMLHRDGRVLTSEWEGWGLLRGLLCDPEGHELTQAQLRAYPLVYAIAQEYGKQNSRARDTLYRLASRDQPASRPRAGASPRSRGSGDPGTPATAPRRAATPRQTIRKAAATIVPRLLPRTGHPATARARSARPSETHATETA